ncbi:hypothetical protein M0813_06717 [Anaeramoeba flamelloides]|uniref:Uncharacterized protein n=1 Tax=Anaeramoeba flamelloides TaxID=1746091 RepID=A0ABQ8XCV8_9EUKA|nr:hypothetical protein M0813_06717 [Anaeramoeba flamelloides]
MDDPPKKPRTLKYNSNDKLSFQDEMNDKKPLGLDEFANSPSMLISLIKKEPPRPLNPMTLYQTDFNENYEQLDFQLSDKQKLDPNNTTNKRKRTFQSLEKPKIVRNIIQLRTQLRTQNLKVPLGWKDTPRMGTAVQHTKIIPLKTPLDKR